MHVGRKRTLCCGLQFGYQLREGEDVDVGGCVRKQVEGHETDDQFHRCHAITVLELKVCDEYDGGQCVPGIFAVCLGLQRLLEWGALCFWVLCDVGT